MDSGGVPVSGKPVFPLLLLRKGGQVNLGTVGPPYYLESFLAHLLSLPSAPVSVTVASAVPGQLHYVD